MSRGFPSMTALLGLLAIAGYQNRDKIAEVISGLGKGAPAPGGLGGLSQETGLSEGELLSRLSRALPDAVDKYTPDGRLPA